MKKIDFAKLSELGLLDLSGERGVRIAVFLMNGEYVREEAVSIAMAQFRENGSNCSFVFVEWYRVCELHRSGDDGTAEPAEATIMLRLETGQEDHVAGRGDGPINALDNAMNKVAEVKALGLELGDYHVFKVGSGGSAARVKVVVDWTFHGWDFRTVATARSVTEASWLAMVDAYEFAHLAGERIE
ncbi:hypothetical protein COV04_03565 [Candidatus Uhrbacteria bacterium CG10_big_fil_rev_8_21_14_0_10_48_11]|uniref:2-isopropylmalate synthase LeuA allosteric (dimerisation) domain-containing protein n=1 Tax=Candidatus Uhrbacteria bacterium CG10_big_fil_rev_8_21_14_0_10_48_11 TaxID=1975037 RepID=A0A2M8LDX3_9BACT|nr:MAG: hypothetical protein COV04_03565 [Candidatus Uhrbacteria bacterium CG10_big_fil_rev_8_21_14_0_10_48_11]